VLETISLTWLSKILSLGPVLTIAIWYLQSLVDATSVLLSFYFWLGSLLELS